MDELAIIQGNSAPNFEHLASHGFVIERDWFGESVSPVVTVLFWVDAEEFHFLASRSDDVATCHPESTPGTYCAELWKYDVCEFFLTESGGNRYLEFNLAPNGAWWSCLFEKKPLKAQENEPSPIPGVVTRSQSADHGWQTHARIPLAWLKEKLQFDSSSRLNATFILNFPSQIFLSAGQLGSGDPDFHRPEKFPTLRMCSET